MREADIKANDDDDLQSWGHADHKDREGLYQAIDDQLADFGLELIVGDFGDADHWVKIEKRVESQ